MKRFRWFLTGLILVSILSLTAFAVTTDNPESTQEIPVYGTYVEGKSATVYSVDIVWGDMNFTYNASKTWNPQTGQYDQNDQNGTKNGWSWNKELSANGLAGNQIEITNRSNADIDAAIEYNVDQSYSDSGHPIEFIFYRDGYEEPFDENNSKKITCQYAFNEGRGPVTKKFDLQPKGVMKKMTNKIQIATITVSLFP